MTFCTPGIIMQSVCLLRENPSSLSILWAQGQPRTPRTNPPLECGDAVPRNERLPAIALRCGR